MPTKDVVYLLLLNAQNNMHNTKHKLLNTTNKITNTTNKIKV